MGLYSVLWGKYKEYKEQEAEIPEVIKGGNNNKEMTTTIVEDHDHLELDEYDVESQRNAVELASRVPNVVISSPMPQPPMLAMEAPMKGGRV